MRRLNAFASVSERVRRSEWRRGVASKARSSDFMRLVTRENIVKSEDLMYIRAIRNVGQNTHAAAEMDV